MSQPTPDAREFRRTMGMFATGVTVVIAGTSDEWSAMTANAVSSLSLEPMLVLFCPRKQASIMPTLEEHRAFSINVLTTQQRDLSVYFANAWGDRPPPAFTLEPWEGAPRLQGCIASIGCRLRDLIDGGDHWIAVGEVLSLHRETSSLYQPLLYYKGRYREVAPTPEHDVPVAWDFSW